MDAAVAGFERHREHAGPRLDPQLVAAADPVIVDILREATDTVAAHFHLAAVGIVDLHLEVGDFRRVDRKELIRADTKAAIAQAAGNLTQVRDLSLQAIDKNKIVPAAVHLGKLEFHKLVFVLLTFELLNL